MANKRPHVTTGGLPAELVDTDTAVFGLPPLVNGYKVGVRNLLALGARFILFGHSMLANGGATSPTRGWENMVAGMYRTVPINHSKGAAVLSWHDRGDTTGDGGWARLFTLLPTTSKYPNWTGAWSSVTAYNVNDGVTSGGNWWVAVAANTNVTPVEGTSWHQITGPTTYGAGDYLPTPNLPILFYGNNDLGWGKDLTVFKESMRSAIARCSAGRVFEDNSPTVAYSGGFAAAVAGNVALYSGILSSSGNPNSGTIRQFPTVLNETVTISVPPDFPGGEVDLGFVVKSDTTGQCTITVDGAAPGAGWGCKIAGSTSGTGVIDFASPARVSTTAGATQNNGIVVRCTSLAAGAHTVVIKVTQLPCFHVYFDYWSVVAFPTAPPVFVCGLFKPLSYAIWTAPLPTDSDVDTWNTGLQSLCSQGRGVSSAGEFSNAVYLDMGACNGTQKYFSQDQLHLDDLGHQVLGADVWDQMSAVYVSDQTLAGMSIAQDQATAATTPTKLVPCRVCSTGNVSVQNFSGTVDGIQPVTGDRLLLVGQTTASENGIWQYFGNGALRRPPDFLTGSIHRHVNVFVHTGTQSGWYKCNSSTAFEVGADNTVWSAVTPASYLAAKGSLVTATAAGVMAGHAAGLDGQVLGFLAANADGQSNTYPANDWFGDGSDGTATFDGTATPAGCTKAGSVYTLTRDVMYTTCALTGSSTVVTAGFRIMATTSVTVAAGSIIHNDGGAGGNAVTTTAGAAGAAAPAGSLPGGQAGVIGGAGTLNTSGTSSANVTNAIGGRGGSGGKGTGTGAFGSGGTITAPVAARGSWRNVLTMFQAVTIGTTPTALVTGTAGGSGTGNTSGGGGGSGGAGGFVLLSAALISNAGTIRANGGVGGNGVAAIGGGGGGGGGGVVALICRTYVNTGTVQAAGGTFGTGDTTGATPTAGAAGLVLQLAA